MGLISVNALFCSLCLLINGIDQKNGLLTNVQHCLLCVVFKRNCLPLLPWIRPIYSLCYVAGPPSCTVPLTVPSATTSSVVVKWSAYNCLGVAPTEYKLEWYSVGMETSLIASPSIDHTVNEYRMTGLSSGTKYFILLTYSSSCGQGGKTSIIAETLGKFILWIIVRTAEMNVVWNIYSVVYKWYVHVCLSQVAVLELIRISGMWDSLIIICINVSSLFIGPD